MISDTVKLENVIKTLLSRELDPDYSIISFHDINGDDLSELVLKTRYSIRVFSPSKNKLLWNFEPIRGEITSAILRDIDRDKKDELLVLSKTDNHYMLHIILSNGTILLELDIGKEKINLSSIRSLKVGGSEAVFIPKKNGLIIYGLNGEILWNFVLPTPGYFYYRINDYDGDGKQELLLAYLVGSNIILEIIDLDTIFTKWSVSFSLEPGEKPYIEERVLTNSVALFLYIGNRLIILDSKNGEKIYEKNIGNVDLFNATADVNGDGKKEIVICSVSERDYTSSLEIVYTSDKQSVKYMFNTAVMDLRIGDYDGDQKEEICAVGFNEVTFFSEYGVIWRVENLFESSIFSVIEDDYDNDGVNELLVIGEVGAAILDLKEKEILWMDNNVIINEIEELFGVGDVLPIDIDEDGEDEILVIDEPNKRIIALKGESGKIRELWTLILRGNELKDIEVLYPNPVIIISMDEKLLAVNSNGEILWEKNNFPTTYLMFGELNGDGKAEIVAYREKEGLFALESDTGRVLWSYNGKVKMMRISDIDGDGKQEVVISKGDTLSILNGETGSQILVKIMESKIKRVDTVDIDSDGVDEIIVSMGDTTTIMKNFEQIWEKHFIDPKAIKGVMACRFYQKNKLDICAYSQNAIYVFDSLTGELRDIQNFYKISGEPLIADVDQDGLDEIIVWVKDKKKLHILGSEDYKTVNVPHRKGFFKVSKSKKYSYLLYILDRRLISALNVENRQFQTIFVAEKNEKILDVKTQDNAIYVLTVHKLHGVLPILKVYRSTLFKLEFTKIHEGPLIWVDKKGSESLKLADEINEEDISEMLLKAKIIQDAESLELVAVGRKKIYLYSKKLNTLVSHSQEKYLEDIAKLDRYIVDNFMFSDRTLQIIGFKDNEIILIDIASEKVSSISAEMGKIVHAISGDFDGDEKKEILIVSSGNRLYFLDPLLSIYGCDQIFDLGYIKTPIKLLSADINTDWKYELIALLDRGLYIYGIEFFQKPSVDLEDYKLSLDKKARFELIKLKIKKLCDNGIIDRELVKRILGEKDSKKALIWKNFSRKDNYENTNMRES